MKDTAGPALNPMIKVVNLVSVIIAPVIVQSTGFGFAEVVTVAVLGGLLYWSIRTSKRAAPAIS